MLMIRRSKPKTIDRSIRKQNSNVSPARRKRKDSASPAGWCTLFVRLKRNWFGSIVVAWCAAAAINLASSVATGKVGNFSFFQTSVQTSEIRRRKDFPRIIASDVVGIHPTQTSLPHYAKLKFPMIKDKELPTENETTEREESEKFEKEDDCQLRHDWQKILRHNCNSIHEASLVANLISPSAYATYLAHGGWRDVWSVQEVSSKSAFVLKTLRFRNGFLARNFENQIMDAQISDRLSASSHVLDMYAFCGMSAAYEFAPDGDLHNVILNFQYDVRRSQRLNGLTKIQKLRIGK
jgi:hypothetical protein